MQQFALLLPLFGGVIIGLSAALTLFALGRVAGISSIFGGLLRSNSGDLAWRAAFVLGLLAGGALMVKLAPGSFAASPDASLATMTAAGLLVGFGARMGDGCTSGHGVCGVSRLSARSWVATLTFMATGALTVFLTLHVFGGPR